MYEQFALNTGSRSVSCRVYFFYYYLHGFTIFVFKLDVYIFIISNDICKAWYVTADAMLFILVQQFSDRWSCSYYWIEESDCFFLKYRISINGDVQLMCCSFNALCVKPNECNKLPAVFAEAMIFKNKIKMVATKLKYFAYFY